MLASLSTPEAFASAPAMLEARAALREAEQLRIERELMTVLGGLATSCETTSTLASFDAFAAEESASLAAERALVKSLLEAAGAEGRALIWQVSDPGTLFVKSRAAQVATAGATLPAWSALQLEEDEELRVRRLLLGLQFAVEALSLDVEAELANFAAEMAVVDPAAADAADKTVAALERVDTSLLGAQRARFNLLPGACKGLGDEAWVGMLERGFVRRYMGTLGGTGTARERAVASTTGGTKGNAGGGTTGAGGGSMASGGQQMGGSASMGGQMGGTQTGGQQMGGTQTGGQQMGGSASMGGQMGGTQTGGQQMGGSQMGGTQSGGQMGGSQMGGTQTGGQMGGTQTGGQMGGSQMGGTQTGGQQMGGTQMGGSQMGGTQTGGQQMGGQQTGGQQMGGQQTGQGGTPQQR
ncbi:MAG: hypothetical protein V4850_10410 [Myxococcota bacterium]